jgi:hypothetical protein
MVLRVTWVWWQTEKSGFPHPPNKQQNGSQFGLFSSSDYLALAPESTSIMLGDY